MKNLSKTILAVLATGLISCALFSQQAHADTIQGDISFVGMAKFDSGNNLATATRVILWKGNNNAPKPVVDSSSGDFATFAPAGSPTDFAVPWIFNPSTFTPGLWKVGGFTFNLGSSTIVTQNALELTITGIGSISGNGFDTTTGTWDFSVKTLNGKGDKKMFFHFNAETTAVPDGGSAVALLGIALTGIEVLRRKLRTT
jgi:hypothetical protein